MQIRTPYRSLALFAWQSDDALWSCLAYSRCEANETMKTIRVGSGAGYSGDRIEPAVELAEKGGLHYLGFECLAERTIALAQAEKLRDREAGFDPLLWARMEAVLPACRANGVRLVTNMGAANPDG